MPCIIHLGNILKDSNESPIGLPLITLLVYRSDYRCTTCYHWLQAPSTSITKISTSSSTRANKTLKCNHCDMVTKWPYVLRRHISIVHEKKHDCRCMSCNLVFPDTETLEKHEENVHKDPLICDHCGEVWKTSKGLRQHKQRNHSDTGIKYTCNECGKTLKNPHPPTLISYNQMHKKVTFLNTYPSNLQQHHTKLSHQQYDSPW
jgi:hypothetical protein